MKNDFYLIRKDILPENFESIIKAREQIENEGYSVTQACKENDISRSTYYKYKDCVYKVNDSTSKHLIITFKVTDIPGVLNSILSYLFSCKVNVLSINQNIPVSNIAFISLTLDIQNLEISIDELKNGAKKLNNVRKVDIIAYE